MPKNENKIEIETTYKSNNPSESNSKPNTNNSVIHYGQNNTNPSNNTSPSNNNQNIARGVQKNNNPTNNTDKFKPKNNYNSPNMPGVVGNNGKSVPDINNDEKGKSLNNNTEDKKENNDKERNNVPNDSNNPMKGVKAPNNEKNEPNNQGKNPNNLINGMPKEKAKKDDKDKNKDEKGNKINKKGDNKKNLTSSLSNIINRKRNNSSNSASGKDGNSSSFIDNAKKSVDLLSNLVPEIKGLKVAIKYAPYIGVGIVVFLLILALFVTTTTTVMSGNGLCKTENSSSDTESSYKGSADVTEFLCQMQSPLGNRSYPLCGFVGEDRDDHVHAGVDLSIGAGVPVYAAQTGKVIRAEYFSGYGNCIDIDHGKGLVTRYAHLANFKVKKSDVVAKGQHIGTEGGSGGYPVHLHFELRKNDEPQQAINHYFNYYGSLSATGDCFMNRTNVSEKFKENCGSSWNGEPTGDSAGKNDDNSEDDVVLDDGGEETSEDSSSSSSFDDSECCDESSSYSSSTSSSGNYCPNGITVTGLDAGTYDLEDYVQRAATCENGGAHTEAVKAQAIAARTFALNATNNCTNSIENSTKKQVMSTSSCREASDKVKKDIADVRGVVLLNNGKLFSAQYSSFYGSCSGDTCTSTLNKIPSSKTSTFTMPKKYLTTGEKDGHSNGMSQNGANYMATENNKTYDEILKFFYADDIEITGSSESKTCNLGKNSFDGDIWPFYQTDYPNDPYGSYGTIATHGCGTTSMAMVVSSFLNEKHDPVELTKYACSNDYCTADGTKHSFFEAAAKKYGFKSKQTTDKNEVLTSLNRGDSLVIALVTNSDFNATGDGHFILLAGGDGEKVKVYDPASKERSKKLYNFENAIVKHALKYWIITMPGYNANNSGKTDVAKKVLDSASKMAHNLVDYGFKYKWNSVGTYESQLKGSKQTNCARYVSWIYQDAGVLGYGKAFYLDHGKIGSANSKKVLDSAEEKGNIKVYHYSGKTMSELLESGKIEPGDALGNTNQLHTFLYAGMKNGKHYVYSVGTNGKNGFTYGEIYQKSKYQNKGIGIVIRPLKAK